MGHKQSVRPAAGISSVLAVLKSAEDCNGCQMTSMAVALALVPAKSLTAPADHCQ